MTKKKVRQGQDGLLHCGGVDPRILYADENDLRRLTLTSVSLVTVLVSKRSRYREALAVCSNLYKVQIQARQPRCLQMQTERRSDTEKCPLLLRTAVLWREGGAGVAEEGSGALLQPWGFCFPTRVVPVQAFAAQ